MIPIRCPYCGAVSKEAAVRDDGSFICSSCGKAVEPPPMPPPAPSESSRDNSRWSDGPTEESASRWSNVAPLGDDESSSSISTSQSSILPRNERDAGDNAIPRPPPQSPWLWPLVIVVLFLAALIGVVVLARHIKPWWDARREAARLATVEYWWPQLENGPDDARQEAARRIVALGPHAVVKTLEHVSQVPGKEEQFSFVMAAIYALAEVGPDVAAGLSEGLRSPEPRVRAAAARVVQQMGRAGRATRDDLLRALNDDSRWVRYSAIDALGRLGGEAGPAARRLAELTASPDALEQRHAIDALAHIGPAAADALPQLEAVASKDPDAMVRGLAALAARQIDVQRLAAKARRDSRRPLNELIQSLLGDDPREAIAAAEKLGAMGLSAGPASAGLAAMLHSDDPARRAAAATALGKIGLGASDFVPSLETAAGDDDPTVRAAAGKALEGINGKPR
jgi:HEAT repeat protein/uncharacterized Zn finger protein (UPF0148 family)